MAFIVDQLFPPIQNNDEDNIEYSSFNYWRDPVSDIDLDFEASAATALPSKPLATIPEN
jgi:phosphatidate phosphatase LPIN